MQDRIQGLSGLFGPREHGTGWHQDASTDGALFILTHYFRIAPPPPAAELGTVWAIYAWTTFNQRDEGGKKKQKKPGLRSASKDSGRRPERAKMMRVRCRPSPANPSDWLRCGGLTTLALIRGDTGPSNLLSAQFLGTMEFRAHRYAILLTAPCLAAWLMRWRIPTGRAKWRQNQGAPSGRAIPHSVGPSWGKKQKKNAATPPRGNPSKRRLSQTLPVFVIVKGRWCFPAGMQCKSPKTLNDVQVDLLQRVTINLRLPELQGEVNGLQRDVVSNLGEVYTPHQYVKHYWSFGPW